MCSKNKQKPKLPNAHLKPWENKKKKKTFSEQRESERIHHINSWIQENCIKKNDNVEKSKYVAGNFFFYIKRRKTFSMSPFSVKFGFQRKNKSFWKKSLRSMGRHFGIVSTPSRQKQASYIVLKKLPLFSFQPKHDQPWWPFRLSNYHNRDWFPETRKASHMEF